MHEVGDSLKNSTVQLTCAIGESALDVSFDGGHFLA
jgi:hypothetical protein